SGQLGKLGHPLAVPVVDRFHARLSLAWPGSGDVLILLAATAPMNRPMQARTMLGPHGTLNVEENTTPARAPASPKRRPPMTCCLRLRLKLRAAAGGITSSEVTRMIPSRRMVMATVRVSTSTNK